MEYLNVKSNKGNLIKGPLIIKPKIFPDSRGYFFESWNYSEFNEIISREVNFVQDNHSESKFGVLRGLHYQLNPKAQAKLVRCTKGKVFDVLADIRKDSKTYGEWSSVILSAQNKLQFWIPEGFAHGFLTISNYAEVLYKTTNYWNKDCEKSIRWDDETLSINWPLNKIMGEYPLLSNKDHQADSFKESFENFF